MNIEEQIREIVKEELEPQLAEIEKRLKGFFSKDVRKIVDQNRELKEQLEGTNGNVEEIIGKIEDVNNRLEDYRLRIEKLEEELSSRWGLLVKLRKYTLDQLMSEYRRLTGSMHPEQEESDENAEI